MTGRVGPLTSTRIGSDGPEPTAGLPVGPLVTDGVEEVEIAIDTLVPGKMPVRHHVEQHHARRAHQRDRPAQDHAGADDSHQRIHEDPAVEPAGKQRDDCQYRGQRVGKHMDIGRAQI